MPAVEGDDADAVASAAREKSAAGADVTHAVGAGPCSTPRLRMSLMTPSPGPVWAVARATAWRHCSSVRRRQVAELRGVGEALEVRAASPAACPSTTPIDSKMPSPRCVLSSLDVQRGRRRDRRR